MASLLYPSDDDDSLGDPTSSVNVYEINSDDDDLGSTKKKGQSYQHDDDDDETNCKKRTTGKGKDRCGGRNGLKRPRVSECESDSDDETGNGTAGYMQRQAEAKARLDAILSEKNEISSPPSLNKVSEIDLRGQDKTTEAILRMKAQLEASLNSGKDEPKNNVKESQSGETFSSLAKNVSLPTVKRATTVSKMTVPSSSSSDSKQHASMSAKRDMEANLNIDVLHELLGNEGQNVGKVGDIGNSTNVDGPFVKLKTRLNGKFDDRKWKFLLTDSLGKLREKLSNIYGLRPQDIKIIFDGEAVRDSDTPSTLDIDDDCIIDVEVSKGNLDLAISNAKNFKGRVEMTGNVDTRRGEDNKESSRNMSSSSNESQASDKLHTDDNFVLNLFVHQSVNLANEQLQLYTLKIMKHFTLDKVTSNLVKKKMIRAGNFSFVKCTGDGIPMEGQGTLKKDKSIKDLMINENDFVLCKLDK